MSLRTRILGLVVAVNVIATVVLGAYFAVDMRRRDQQAHESAEQLSQQRVREVFIPSALDGNSIVIDVAGGERSVSEPEVYGRLRRHPVYRLLDSGVVEQCVLMDRNAAHGRPGIHLNLPGASDRYITHEHLTKARVREAIAEADRGELNAGTTASGASWFAVPVRLFDLAHSTSGRRRLGRDVEGQVWGGMYFVLPPRREEADWAPLFGTWLYWLGLSTAVLVAVTWVLLDRWVLRPLTELAQGATRVRAGNHTVPVPRGRRGDEIDRTVTAFNAMMHEVREAQSDLTERVEVATARAEESRRGLVIAQRLAATGTLASGIAHEINNPLGGLRNATARLRKEAHADAPNREVQERYLDLLDGGLQRIQQIVRRVLTFSPRQVRLGEVSLRELTQKAIALAEHRASKCDAQLAYDGGDARVLAEPGEIQQVILNLLLNAVDAMADAGGGTVRVTVAESGDRAVLEVHDEGPGMTEDVRERVFDLFFTTKEVGEGTGLGLSVAHHIVEQHGGTLTVHAAEPKGSVFRMELPLR